MKILLAAILLSLATVSFADKQPNIDPNDQWNDYESEKDSDGNWLEDSWVWEDDWNVYDE